jgi:hypothetical protein
MGNKTTVEVTEQTLYNIDILEDETTVVTIEVPQDIVTVEVSQFTIALELYNSDNDAEGQPVYAKSGSDFTLRSFTDDDKTIDISHAGPSTELIQVKLPDSGIRVQDGFVISTDSDDTANITFNGSNIDIYGVDDIAVSNLTATNATITTGTVTTLDGDTLDYNTGSIDDLTSTNITTTNVDATLATVTTGNITTINSTTITNTGDLDVGGEANVAGNLAVTLDTTIGGNTAIGGNTSIGGNATITQDVSANNAYITNNITATDIDTDTGSIDALNVVTATASDEFIGDIRGAVRFRAKAGEALVKGDVVYVSGVSGNTPVVNKADASDPSKMPAYGLAFSDANNNSNVEIVTFGALQGIPTGNFNLGTIWVSTTPGSLTQIKPTDPTHLIQNIGRVKRVHNSNGAIIVGGAGRTNDVPNEFSILGNIATAANMSANNITITNDITTDDLTGNQATITDITATTINTDTIDANTGNITTVNATTVNTVDNNVSNLLVAPAGNITTVNATDVNTTNLATTLITADTGNITTVNATTVNTVDISATGNADVTGNLSVTGDATLSSDVVVGGNLTVNGTTTTVNTETLEVADNNIVLNSNHTGTPTQDAGFTVERGDADDAVFQWNETTDKFEVKVGTADAVIKAGDLESVNLTATQATITTGDFTTVNATTVNTTNLDLENGSIDTLNAGTIAATGNITTDASVIINGGNLDLNGGNLQDVTEINDLSVLRIGIENPAEASGDGIVLWDKQNAWILENKLTTNNNTDDIHHTGGVAPIGDIVYISNEVINMSANIVATGGTNSTVIKSGRIALEKSGLSNNITIDAATGIQMGGRSITSGNIIPNSHLTFSLGTPTKAWHSAYIGPGSLYIEGQKVIGSTDGTIDFTTDDGENMNIFAGANGPGGSVIINSASGVTRLEGTDIRLNPVGSGTTTVRGTLEAPNFNNGPLEFSGTLINQTSPNQNLEIRTNGTGYLHANVADLYVGPLTGALKIDENSLSLTAGGNIAIQNNTDITGDLDVSGLVKVNDGFTLGSFNPFAGSGLPATAMDTTIMGVGQESGYAGVTIRSRGEHSWGLEGFGIPPEAPRALLALQGGRLDGSSDDYLNSGDRFGQMMFNPYSGYRTGVEWLTPSAIVEAAATQDHWQGGTAGFGTKLRLWTTKDGDFGGSTDSQHAKSWIDIQGTTITTSDTLKIDDDLQVTGAISNPDGDIIINDKVEIKGSNAKETIIGDDQIAGSFDIHGIKVKADDTAWGSVLIQEYEGGANKPAATGFLNPSFGTEIIGGTPSSPSNVSSGKRLFVLQALAANQTDGTLPQTANFRIKAETTETQTTSARGTKVSIETTANGSTSTTESVSIQDNELTINTGGNGVIRAGNDLRLGSQLDTNNNNIINSGGDVTVGDNLKVNDNLTVDGQTNLNGNVNLGNANTDVITATGKLKASNGFKNTVLDTATANYLANVLGIIETGDQGYISDGNNGSPCMAFFDGSNWKKFHAPNDNISAT